MIKGIPGIPGLLRTRKTAKVIKGFGLQDAIILNPVMEATSCLNFEHDFLWVSSAINPFYTSLTQSIIPKELNRVATLIEVMILNRSGANDDYDWYLWNGTTNETLLTVENTAINNKTWKSWHVVVGADKINEGDAIYFVTYDGILGTAGTEPILGQYKFNMTSLVDTKTFSEWLGVESI